MHFGRFSVVTLSLIFSVAFLPPKKKFIDPANMDLSVKPGDNFYLYANGNWLKKNPIPSSKVRWGSFDELRELSSRRLKSLLDEAAAKASTDSSMQKIGDFYSSGMDSLTLEKLGSKPIEEYLNRIAAIRDVNGLLNEVVYQQSEGICEPLFHFSVDQDRKKATDYIPQLQQGGTTLPDRDYYISNTSKMSVIRAAYLKHIQTMLVMIGVSPDSAAARAKAILKIETALAKAQNSRVEMRDPYKTYNKYAIKDLNAATPSMDWNNLLMQLGLPKVDSVIVNNPVFFRAEDLLLTALPIDDWKAYLSWQVISDAASFLSNSFVQEDFNFSKILTGQKEPTPRWQKMGYLIDSKLGELIGRIYVDKYFKPAAKQRMQELVDNLQQTFASRIQHLDWMSPETKQKALEKLNAFTKKIAYPDQWKEYKTVVIKKNDLIGNIQNTNRWAYEEMIGHYGKPVDKKRWIMTPPTINAYYNTTNNEIVFPAGILQFPFFDFEADDAVNYGGIAAVIGHEMTHGFDDNGRQYGPEGNLRDWWTSADADNFKKRADLVVQEYNALTVQDSIHINGRLTLGENLADLGGLSMAYEAFTHTRQFKEGKKIDGFTPAQRFFLNWAQVWRNNILPQTEAQYILVDPHSPGMHRANGPLVNIDAWYEAFGVKEGDKMFVPADKRIRVW